MPVYLRSLLFYLLLLLVVVCCTLYNGVHADNQLSVTASQIKSVELLQVGTISISLKKDGTNEDKQNIFVKNYYSPFLVSAGDVLLALAGVNSTNNDNNDKNITIISKYIVTAGKDNSGWGSKVVSNSSETKGGWKTQFVVQGKLKDNGPSVKKGMLAAAKDDKIYVLLVNCSDTSNDAKCELNLTVGTVDEADGKKITWNDGKLDGTNNLENLIKKEGNQKLYPSGGSAFVTAEKKVVFVVLIANEQKNIFAVIYLEDGTETKFKASKVENVDGCTPFFFLWEENKKIIMMPTHCTEKSKNNQRVKESNDMGSNWSEITGSFARLLGFMQDKNDFLTTKINDISVLLFTQQKSKTTTEVKGPQKQFDVHVWFTDGNRVSTAGRIVTEDNITSSKLLHTKGELFGLYQNIKERTSETITLTQLDDHLKNITTVITAWKATDNFVKSLFKDTSLGGISSITDGLVGFLSNRSNVDSDKKEWIDEYIYVNATMNKGKKVDGGGVKFEGKEEGAKWPVGKSKEDQPYNFTDPGFTLVANVTIGTVSAAQNNNSLLGVGLSDNKHVGLWCTTEGKWGVSGDEGGGSKQTSKNDCKKNREYHVALVYLNNKLSVYVDWEELKELAIQNTNTQQFKNITYFYFGADESQKDVESNVTVRNVLLYNRPFTENEIAKLKKAKNTNMEKNDKVDKEHPKKENDKNTNGQSDVGITGGGGNNGGENTTHENTTNNNNGNSGEEEENLTSQSEVSMVRRALSLLMLSLLLLLLDVFWVGVLL